jgi:hypothetical protein
MKSPYCFASIAKATLPAALLAFSRWRFWILIFAMNARAAPKNVLVSVVAMVTHEIAEGDAHATAYVTVTSIIWLRLFDFCLDATL